jgi:hypothetical protein
MRFKARLMKDNLLVFASVLNMLERVGTTAVVFLNEENIRLAVVTESPDSPKVFSEFKQENLFFDYRIESQNSNSILFEIEIDLLLQALASGKHAPQCLLKLVKRGPKPFLCFESRVGVSRACSMCCVSHHRTTSKFCFINEEILSVSFLCLKAQETMMVAVLHDIPITVIQPACLVCH